MINEEVRMENKTKFINLVNTITRPGADLPGLIQMLEQSDFFDAPATANSFRNFPDLPRLRRSLACTTQRTSSEAASAFRFRRRPDPRR